MKSGLPKKLIIPCIIILFGIGVIGCYIYSINKKLLNSATWVHHSEQVSFQTSKVLYLFKDLEIATKGFVITNDTSFLQPLSNAEKASEEYIEKLRKLTIDNQAQQKRIDQLNLYMQKRLVYSMKIVEIRRTEGLAAATAYQAANPDKQYSALISKIIFDIQQEENVLLEQREQKSQGSIMAFSRLSILMFILITVFTILLFLIAVSYYYQNGEMGKRAAELKVAERELTFQNEEKEKRAAELKVADKELAFQNEEKRKRAVELTIANKKLLFQNEEKEKRAAELTVANQELLFQNNEKGKRAAELIIVNTELIFQNSVKVKQAEELIIAHKQLVKIDAQMEFDKNNLMALINNTTDLMWTVDTDYKLITSNQHFDDFQKLMTGEKILKGNTLLSELLSAEKRNQCENSYNRAFAGESFIEIEHRDVPVKCWAEITYNPIKNGDEIIGTACHSHDITERKLAELERIKITDVLLQRNHALEQFTYIISHNLRAPVANITGIAHSICAMKLNVEKENRMKVNLTTSVNKLDEVIKDINQILQFNKEINEQKELVLFSTLFLDIQLHIGSIIKTENVVFVTNFAEIAEIITVKSYLYSIFFNIILNSIKFKKPHTSTVIEITSKMENKKIVLIFKDNGNGIDLTKWGDQVFGLYKRFNVNTEGKGMGLYMVKAQVEALGGKIFINSAVNEGTEFKIEFNN